MSLRFYVDNLVKSALITASENDAQFPVNNLKDDRRTKIYRSTSGSCSIVFDLGTVRNIDTVSMVDSGIDLIGFSSAIIELNNVDSWLSPAVTQNLTIDPLNGWVNHNWATDQSYRFARIVLTNGVSPVEVSKIFIGKSTFLESVCFSYPVSFRQNNRATSSINRYGQKFFDEISSQKELKGDIPSMNKDEVDLIFSMIDYASFTVPVWVYFNSSNFLNDENRMNGYYYLADDPTLTLQAGNFWNVSLAFQEGM